MPSNIFLAFLSILKKTDIFLPKNAKILKNVMKLKLGEKSGKFLENPKKWKEYVRLHYYMPEKCTLDFLELKKGR